MKPNNQKDIDGFLGVAGRWTIALWNENSDKESDDKLRMTIRFYDSKNLVSEKNPLGQFTGGGYFVTTLLAGRKRLEKKGLDLNFDVESWKVSPEEMKQVFRLLDAA